MKLRYLFLVVSLVGLLFFEGCTPSPEPILTQQNTENYKIKISKKAEHILDKSEKFIWTQNNKENNSKDNFCKDNIFCNHKEWDIFTYRNQVFYVKYIKGYNSFNSVFISEKGMIYIPSTTGNVKLNGNDESDSSYYGTTNIIFPYPKKNKSVLTIDGQDIQLNLPNRNKLMNLMSIYKNINTNYNYKKSFQYLVNKIVISTNYQNKEDINKKLDLSVFLALGKPIINNINYNPKTEKFTLNIISSSTKPQYTNYAKTLPKKIGSWIAGVEVNVKQIKDLDFFNYVVHLVASNSYPDQIYCFSSICAHTLNSWALGDIITFMNPNITDIPHGIQDYNGYDVILKRNSLNNKSRIKFNIGGRDFEFNLQKRKPVFSQQISVKIPKKYASKWKEIISKKGFTPHLICKIQNGKLKIVGMKEAGNYKKLVSEYIQKENLKAMKKAWQYTLENWNLDHLEEFLSKYPNSPYNDRVIAGIKEFKNGRVMQKITNQYFNKNDYVEWKGDVDKDGWPVGKGKLYISRVKDASYGLFSYNWKKFIDYNIYTTFKNHRFKKGTVSAYYRQIGIGSFKDYPTDKYSFKNINQLYKAMKQAKDVAWRNHEGTEDVKENAQKNISIKHCHMERKADDNGNYQSCEVFVNGSFKTTITAMSDGDNYQIDIYRHDSGLYFPNLHQLSYGNCGKKNNVDLNEAMYYSAECAINGHY